MAAEIQELRRKTVPELRAVWRRVFGTETRNRNKDYLWRRIAARLQEQAEGGLSESARARLEVLLLREPLRVRRPLLPVPLPVGKQRDPRLPAPGRVLLREFAGRTHRVAVLDDGFEYEDKRYESLSSVAREIAGSRWNGFRFFGIAQAAGSTP
jgi:hypothetical protein